LIAALGLLLTEQHEYITLSLTIIRVIMKKP